MTAKVTEQDIHGVGDDIDYTPALGLTWGNYMTSRLLISNTNTFHDVPSEDNEGNKNTPARIRLIQIIKCPWMSRLKLQFVITKDGVRSVKET